MKKHNTFLEKHISDQKKHYIILPATLPDRYINSDAHAKAYCNLADSAQKGAVLQLLWTWRHSRFIVM